MEQCNRIERGDTLRDFLSLEVPTTIMEYPNTVSNSLIIVSEFAIQNASVHCLLGACQLGLLQSRA